MNYLIKERQHVVAVSLRWSQHGWGCMAPILDICKRVKIIQEKAVLVYVIQGCCENQLYVKVLFTAGKIFHMLQTAKFDACSKEVV